MCHYWYFKDIGFKYGPYLWCYDLITIVYILKEVLIEFIFGI